MPVCGEGMKDVELTMFPVSQWVLCLKHSYIYICFVFFQNKSWQWHTCEGYMVNGLYLHSTVLTSGDSKQFTIWASHSYTHSYTDSVNHARQQPQPARPEQLVLGILFRDTATLGGAGDWTSNLTVARQPALPPAPLPSNGMSWFLCNFLIFQSIYYASPLLQFKSNNHNKEIERMNGFRCKKHHQLLHGLEDIVSSISSPCIHPNRGRSAVATLVGGTSRIGLTNRSS